LLGNLNKTWSANGLGAKILTPRLLTSSSGGFVLNSPETGNGSPQTPGNNPFYAGANGLAAFAPATITLSTVPEPSAIVPGGLGTIGVSATFLARRCREWRIA
jgi:hypothetical protein